MQLEHTFTVPVPIDRAWAVLLDIEQVAPCMPGASLDSVEGDEFTGTVKVKVGPINLTYVGRARFTGKDEAMHTATIDAQGRDRRGNGTAAAVVNASLQEEGESTRVHVRTDLTITGKPAQFGRGVMADVGDRLITRFADCLAEKIGASGAAAPPPEPAGPVLAVEPATPTTEPHPEPLAPAATAETSTSGTPTSTTEEVLFGWPRTHPPQSAEPIDLLQTAGLPVLKRAAPAIGALAAVGLVVFLLRRRRR